MEAFVNSFFLVAVSEMGDKTQLLTLMLTLRFRKPWTIMAGILVATLLNHGLASYLGGWLSQWLAPDTLRYVLAFTFVAFAAWILIPDKDGDAPRDARFGAFFTTVIAFFLAEMGDKTQLATVALGAKYQETFLVTLGTTLGMMFSNALAVVFGETLTKKIPLKYVRIFAAVSFLLFGLAILLSDTSGR